MLSEIRDCHAMVGGSVVQLIYRDKDGSIEAVKTYDGETARLIVEVAEHVIRVTDAEIEKLKARVFK